MQPWQIHGDGATRTAEHHHEDFHTTSVPLDAGGTHAHCPDCGADLTRASMLRQQIVFILDLPLSLIRLFITSWCPEDLAGLTDAVSEQFNEPRFALVV